MTIVSASTPTGSADPMDTSGGLSSVAPASEWHGAASVSDVMSNINSTLKSSGGAYSGYSCKTVSWDDVTRGNVGGQLSCWGANITDTRLYAKSGQQLYTVRSDNFNEKLGKVSANELALITGNQEPGGGSLSPITLADFLRGMGKHGTYAGLDKSVDLSDTAADAEVSIRFMTTFLPVAEESLAAMEFAPEMYQYQTRSDSDPANLLLLATTQGVAVQANGAGATKLFHHAVEPSKQICRYWFEAERSEKKVGGAQKETKEEQMAAAARGKATASVIGTRAMGTRFNVLMTIQVPLKQQPPPKRRGAAFTKSAGKSYGAGGGGGGFGMLGMLLGGVGGGGGGGSNKSALSFSDDEECDDEDLLAEMEDWSMSIGAVPSSCMQMALPPMAAAAMAPPPSAPMGLGAMMGGAPPLPPMTKSCCRSRSASSRASAAPRVGTANAARVSRGSMVDKLEKTVKVAKPTRDPSQHVTVTVVIYNTVAGGVPSAADVKAAVEDMEQLYSSCGWKGKLASEGAGFMKQELTVKDAMDISQKLASQPYTPPAGSNLVLGGDVFPTSVA